MIHASEALLWLILGAILGGIIQAGVSLYADFKEGQGIALALAAELNGLRDLIVFREYLSLSEQVLTRLAEPGHVVDVADIFAVPLTQDFLSVFHGVSSKIGLLGPTSTPVVGLYSLIKGLFEDFRQFEERREDFLDASKFLGKMIPSDKPELANEVLRIVLIKMTEDVRILLQKILSNTVIDELEAYAKKDWLSHVLPRR
jgi:hypothetical protein